MKANKAGQLTSPLVVFHRFAAVKRLLDSTSSRIYLWLLLSGLLSLLPAAGLAETISRIGVLSHRGDAATLQHWSPTAEYLTRKIPGYRFEVVPLKFEQVEPAIANRDVDFVVVNSGIYVYLEVRHRVSRIATLNNRRGDVGYNIFGGVVFTRADNQRIWQLDDLRDKSVAAVDEISLGGYQMAWREMAPLGMSPKDFSRLEFLGTHDAVVQAVLDGRVQAGMVRSNILERLARDGRISLDQVRIINPQQHPPFPFLHSTRLYPEWPFSKLLHTPKLLAQQVAIALLEMAPDDPAALAGQNAGWTIPLDYQPVHELFQELKLPPYEAPPSFTLTDAIQRYWYWIVTVLVFISILTGMMIWVARLNRELARSKQRLEQRHELILNSVGDGIYGVDTEGRSTFVNKAMERMTGWRAEEMIGKNQHQMLHHTRKDGSNFPGDECPVYATYADGVPRFIEDDIFWRKDGSSFPVEYSSTPIRDESSRMIGSVVVFRDISERKRAEQELRQHQTEIAHVARLSTLGEMASGIAHELNQPLTAIATNARACIRLMDGADESLHPAMDAMERIAQQAERAGSIISQLRKFARKEPLEMHAVSLAELIHGVVILLQHEASRQQVRIEIDIPDPQALRVKVQRIQIEQVLFNLGQNAIDAMVAADSPQRLLRFTSRIDDAGRVDTRVQDTGPGVSDDMRRELFNPFVTNKAKGMGLGLTISHRIIEAHGGTLELLDSGGRGALFRFTLPLDKGDNNNA